MDGSLPLHSWFFKIATSELFAYDPETWQFSPLTGGRQSSYFCPAFPRRGLLPRNNSTSQTKTRFKSLTGIVKRVTI